MMPINNLCITPLIEMEKENLAKDIAVETKVARKRHKGEENRERLAAGDERKDCSHLLEHIERGL